MNARNNQLDLKIKKKKKKIKNPRNLRNNLNFPTMQWLYTS